MIQHCDDNKTEAAARLGITTKALRDRLDGAFKKAGPIMAKKIKTEQAGRGDKLASGDSGSLPGRAGRADPLKHHYRNDRREE